MKSEQIDWSKAPEWATGYGFLQGGFGIEAVWFNEEQYLPLLSRGGYGPYPFGGGIGPHMHNASMGQIQFQQHKPGAWSGEGLPPAGLVLEYMWNYKPEGSEYVQVEILMHDKGSAVMRALDGPYPGVLRESRGGYCGPGRGQPIFRPIRTPEQIAADEREAEIFAMVRLIEGSDKHGAFEQLGVLYDAGLRMPNPGAQ